MNRIYRLVWNRRCNAYVAVSEVGPARGKSHRVDGCAAVAALVLSLGAVSAHAVDVLPTGGQVTAGQASISTSGSVMNVQQGSQRAAINWQSFNIGSAASVNFQQPNASAVLLNRVVGGAPSVIDGAINANGNIYIVNADGVVFNRSAQVNVGGLVASSLGLSDADFMAGKTSFEANGARGSVINLGTLKAANGGHIALLGAKVANEGVIEATLGSAVLAAGDKLTLNFNGDSLVRVTVDRGTLNALVENRHAIMADGGVVTLTAKGLDEVMRTVVNNTGEVRAQTVANREGRIYLLGGMDQDRIEVGGKLDASAPQGGRGGFVETSAARVQIADALRVDTRAAAGGATGTWLIDPTDFTIAAGSGSQSSSGIGATTLANALSSSDVAIQTQAAGAGAGDINVNAALAWSANKLTLEAHGDINVNAVMTASGTSSLDLKAGWNGSAYDATKALRVGVTVDGSGNPSFNGKIDFQGRTGTGALSINGESYTLVNALGSAGDDLTAGNASLQGLGHASNLAGRFALSASIDASSTVNWNSDAGFTSIGSSSAPFTGKFNGLGQSISGLFQNNSFGSPSSAGNVGLFGAVSGARLSNVGITGASYAWGVADNTGLLAGAALNSQVHNVLTTGDYTASPIVISGLEGAGGSRAGGVVGDATDTDFRFVYSKANVHTAYTVGGLIGRMTGGTLMDAAAYGNVEAYLGGGNTWGQYVATTAGGLVAEAYSTDMARVSFGGKVHATAEVGGIVGRLDKRSGSNAAAPTISDATSTWTLTTSDPMWSAHLAGGAEAVGGIVGRATDATLNNVTSSGNFSFDTAWNTTGAFGGLVGRGTRLTVNNSSSSGTYILNGSGSGDGSGGLVGDLLGGTVTASHSSVFFSDINNSSHVGGLVGIAINGAVIQDSDATGNIATSCTSLMSCLGSGIGGLVGNMSGGQIINSRATDAQGTGGSIVLRNGNNVGGLVGGADGVSISNSWSTRQVQVDQGSEGHGIDNIGGLVGYALNTSIADSHATGNVGNANTVASNVGGLVGYMDRSGSSTARITQSYATGNVQGQHNVGGLVGKVQSVDSSPLSATSALYRTYAQGNVTSSGTGIGGLVGLAINTGIEQSYASGQVVGTDLVGGLVGWMDAYQGTYYGYLRDVYATGAVGNFPGYPADNVGGLVGMAGSQAAIYIVNGYASGAVTLGAGSNSSLPYVGAFIGQAANVQIQNSFYDSTVNSGMDGVGSAPGAVTGLTGNASAVMKTTGTYTGVTPPWDFNGIWLRSDSLNNGYPVFLWGNSTSLGFTLSDITGYTYNGNAVSLNSLWSAGTIFGAGYASWVAGSDYEFTYNSAAATGFTNAGLYSNIGINILRTGFTAASSGNTVGSLTISPKALTVTGLTANNKAYDSTTAAMLTGGTLNGVVGSDAVSVGTGNFASANAGTGIAVSVALAGAGASNYTLTPPSGLVADITPKVLTVSASKTYDGQTSLSSGQLTVGGLVGSETLSYSNATAASKDVGSGNHVASLTLGDGSQGGLASNYQLPTLDAANAPANITAKALSISGSTAANKTYDGNATASVTAGSLSGMVGSDAVNVTASGSFANANAGTGKSVSVTYTLDNTNYSLAGETVLADILAKALSISGSVAANKTYDGNTSASVTAGTLGGVVGSDVVNVSASGSFANASAGTGKSVTVTYTLDNTNYSLAGDTVLADILAKALSISGTTAANKTYDGSTTASVTAGTLGGVVGSDVVNASASGSFATAAAGTGKSVSVTYSLDNPNYSLAGDTVLADVAAKALSLSGNVTANNKAYDGTTAATLTGGSLSGVVGSDVVSLGGSNFASANAGTGIAISVALGGADAGNYTLTPPSGLVADITPKVLSISASKTYDGQTSLSSGQLSVGGLVGSETLSYSGATAASKDVGGGNHVAALTLADGSNGGLASNYQLPTLDAANAPVTITPKALSIAGSTAANKVYDGNTSANATAGMVSGLVGNDAVNVSASASFANAGAGTGKSVSVTYTLDNTNYSLGGETVLADILAKALSISGSTAANKTYDGNTTASVTAGALAGLVGSDAVNVTASGSFANASAGTGKSVTVTYTLDNPNYSLAGETVLADIAAKALSISGSVAASKAYDGNTTASVTAGTLSGVVGSDTVNVSASGSFTNAAAGTGKSVNVTYTLDNTNYSLAGETVLADILAKALRISGTTAASKAYDGSTTASVTAGSVSGLVGNDAVNVSASGRFASAGAGMGKSVTVTYTLDNPNYSLAGETVLADILAKALSISGSTAANKTYDGSTTASVTAGALGGVVGNDTVNVTASGRFASAAAGTGKSVSVTYTLDNPNYSLTGETLLADIAARTLSIGGTVAASKAYDGSTSASVTVNPGSLTGVVTGESAPTVTASGRFADASAGQGKSVTVTYTLSDANYRLADETVLADIAARALSIGGTVASSKAYDGSTTANVTLTPGTLTGMVAGEAAPTVTASGRFADAGTGQGKSVTVTYSLSDPNYRLADDTVLADILARSLSISGTTVASSRTGGLTASPGTITGLVGGQTLGVTAQASLDPADPTQRTVVVTYTLVDGSNGGLASNYSLATTTAALPVQSQTETTLVNAAGAAAQTTLLAPESGQPGTRAVDALLPASYLFNVASRTDAGPVLPPVGAVVIVPAGLNLGFGNGTDLVVMSSPKQDEPTTPVTISQARAMTGAGTAGRPTDVRVPVSRNSLAEIVNGGVRLPGGVEQQLFVVKR